jgi:hypothetical protein
MHRDTKLLSMKTLMHGDAKLFMKTLMHGDTKLFMKTLMHGGNNCP